MNEPRPEIDLSTFDRPSRPDIPPPRRRLMGLLVPLAIILAFGGILWWSAGDLLRSPAEVTVLRPQLGELRARAGDAVLQAAGWIEPDPFPIFVPALTPGVLEEVLVQESDPVKKGQALARLVDEDALIARDLARAALAKVESELLEAEAELNTAQRSFDEKVELTEALESALAAHAGKRAEVTHRERQIEKSRTEVEIAQRQVELQRFLEKQGVDGAYQVDLAVLAVQRATEQLAIDVADLELARHDVAEAAAKRKRAERDLELRLEDGLRVERARARRDRSRAARDQAQAQLAEAELRCSRMIVRAPTDGVVLARTSAPGSMVGMVDGAVPVCTLYDPQSLRVRVDVPQTRISLLSVGQKAEIQSQARTKNPYAGEVVRIVQESDIQKVTLQVHVRVLDPDALLRPEMLCTARFLASEQPQERQDEESARTILIPSELVRDGRVWIVAADGESAESRAVEIGSKQGEMVEILSGLDLSAKLIDRGRDDLSPGQSLRIQESK
jgi:HlyD family secretion protein